VSQQTTALIFAWLSSQLSRLLMSNMLSSLGPLAGAMDSLHAARGIVIPDNLVVPRSRAFPFENGVLTYREVEAQSGFDQKASFRLVQVGI
jgi:hypothetical protein